MVHNVELCSPNDIDLIIIIISSSSHFLERQSIRETWGSMSRMMNIRSQRLFVVGYRYGNSMFQELSNEAQYEHDLLYLSVNDDSVTLKELHAYKWLEKYCPNVAFTFKTNDNLFVNSFLLHDLIRELKTNPDQFQNRYLYNNSLESLFIAHNDPGASKFLFGWPQYPVKPERNKARAYYVSYEEYPEDSYPLFCSSLCFFFFTDKFYKEFCFLLLAFGYLMDSKTRNLLTKEGFKDKSPFGISDVFIAGMLPARLTFNCDRLPFTYYQGTTDECINIIKTQNLPSSMSPLLVCSTNRHFGRNTLSDYYKIWSLIKHVYYI
jgi:hypothetical protein